MFNRFMYSNKQGLFIGIGSTLLFLYSLNYEFNQGEFSDSYTTRMYLLVYSLIFISLVFSVRAVYSIVRLRKMMENSGETPYKNLTNTNLELPNKLQERIVEIEALGLTQFAVLETTEEPNNPQIYWYWVDETYTVRAYSTIANTSQKALTGFVTVMEDESVIETVYNFRVQMDTDSLHIRNITSSLSTAYDFHLQQIANYENQHGKPLAIKNIEELIEWNNLIKQKHQPSAYENRIKYVTRNMMSYVVLVICFSLALFASRWISLIIAVSFAGIIVGVIFSFLKLHEVKEAFGSVEGRKKQKN